MPDSKVTLTLKRALLQFWLARCCLFVFFFVFFFFSGSNGWHRDIVKQSLTDVQRIILSDYPQLLLQFSKMLLQFDTITDTVYTQLGKISQAEEAAKIFIAELLRSEVAAGEFLGILALNEQFHELLAGVEKASGLFDPSARMEELDKSRRILRVELYPRGEELERLRQDHLLWLEFWPFLTFLHHGIEKIERHLLWKLHKIRRKSWSNVPPKLLACIRFLCKVAHKIARLRKFNRVREIESNFWLPGLSPWNLAHLFSMLELMATKRYLRFFMFCPGT